MRGCLAVCAGENDQSDLPTTTLGRHIKLEMEKIVLGSGTDGPAQLRADALVVKKDGAKRVLADPQFRVVFVYED